MQEIDKLIYSCFDKIEHSIGGFNFLEKFKYLLVDQLKTFDLTNINFNDLNEYSKEYEDNILLFKIEKISENISKIKRLINNDNLSIIINGLKTVNIYDKSNGQPSNKISLTKFTGIVLVHNTMIDELITKGTILINITHKFKEKNATKEI